MNPKGTQEFASKQLDRILGFFPRVEAKASFLFAMNAGLLTLLAINLRLEDFQVWFVVLPAVVALLLIVASLYFVYQCSFPHLKGGADSLIYFREIAKKTEANFIKDFLAQDEDSHARDLLGQVWRNSEILKIKFDALKTAFILTAVALIPWIAFLAAAALTHSPGLIFK
jgi:hypothetical protein